jgi:ABC-type transporter Mla subunit MlaD
MNHFPGNSRAISLGCDQYLDDLNQTLDHFNQILDDLNEILDDSSNINICLYLS